MRLRKVSVLWRPILGNLGPRLKPYIRLSNASLLLREAVALNSTQLNSTQRNLFGNYVQTILTCKIRTGKGEIQRGLLRNPSTFHQFQLYNKFLIILLIFLVNNKQLNKYQETLTMEKPACARATLVQNDCFEYNIGKQAR